MSKFLQTNDNPNDKTDRDDSDDNDNTKAIAIPQVFSENSQAKNKKKQYLKIVMRHICFKFQHIWSSR